MEIFENIKKILNNDYIFEYKEIETYKKIMDIENNTKNINHISTLNFNEYYIISIIQESSINLYLFRETQFINKIIVEIQDINNEINDLFITQILFIQDDTFYILVGSYLGHIYLFNITNKNLNYKYILKFHSNTIIQLYKLNKNKDLIITSTKDGNIIVGDFLKNKPLYKIKNIRKITCDSLSFVI